ncbi:MAG: hypothetical protein HYS24_12955 [Ignavibacteriales bacterium]|nr:hypothetical protein [Ignavibacteriales bacterium]
MENEKNQFDIPEKIAVLETLLDKIHDSVSMKVDINDECKLIDANSHFKGAQMILNSIGEEIASRQLTVHDMLHKQAANRKTDLNEV